MGRISIGCLLVFLFVATTPTLLLNAKSTARTASLVRQPDRSKRIPAVAYGKVPLSFEANQGQTDPRVEFISRGSGYSLFLTSNEAVLTLRKGAPASKTEGGV